MWKPEYEKRIHVMVGNLDQNGLGLAKEEVEFIEKEIDYILHNGANVNFSIPYESIKKEKLTTKILGSTMKILAPLM